MRTWCFQEIVRIARNISASPRRSPRWQRGPHSRDGQDDGVARVVLVSVVPVGTVERVGGRWLRTGLTAAAQTFYFLSTTAVLGRHLFGKGQNFAKCKISFPFWRRMVEMFAQEK